MPKKGNWQKEKFNLKRRNVKREHLWKTNKEIYLLRLAVVTKCNQRCKYCFIKKTNKTITYSNAQKAINLLLNSKGRDKILIIYGGEPSLCFSLLKRIIIFAQKKAASLNKYLIISIGTNGTLLDPSQLIFFKQTDVKLAISLDGSKKFHNRARIFRNGRGSFDNIFMKIPLILKYFKKKNLCVLFGVLPSSAYKMYDNLIYLTNLGFDSINIEPVQSSQFKWSKKQKKAFLVNLIKIIKHIHKNIHYGKFIFLNSVNRELKNKRLSIRRNTCPFFENLEVYPEGEIAFSPFLINSENRDQYIIGNIKAGLPKKYIFCNFHPNNENCKNCWQDYLGDDNQDYGDSDEILKWRDDYSIYLSQKISASSRQQPIFKRYIQEAKKRIFE